MTTKTKAKIKELRAEAKYIHNYWHDKMAYPYSDDYTKMCAAREEYLDLLKRIKRLKSK